MSRARGRLPAQASFGASEGGTVHPCLSAVSDASRPLATIVPPERLEAFGAPSYQPVDTQSPSFRRWFGGSKIVDPEGRPLPVYHGTNEAFSAFEIPEGGVAYFTPDPRYGFIDRSGTVIPVFLSIQNPYFTEHLNDVEGAVAWPEWVADLKAKGHDGIVYAKREDLTRGPLGWADDRPQFVVFSATQIKSALSNTGAFDPSSPEIRS